MVEVCVFVLLFLGSKQNDDALDFAQVENRSFCQGRKESVVVKVSCFEPSVSIMDQTKDLNLGSNQIRISPNFRAARWRPRKGQPDTVATVQVLKIVGM